MISCQQVFHALVCRVYGRIPVKHDGAREVNRTIMAFLIGGMAILSYLPAVFAADLTNLRCEYLVNPLGIDVRKPRLGWTIESARRGERQTSYQVLVASTPELLAEDKGDLWDSGQVASDQSIQVEYAGKPLTSQTRCHWKVRVWDKDGKRLAWSQPALWTMGPMKPEDWQGAKWISVDGKRDQGKDPLPVSPWLRKTFDLKTVPDSAFAYVNVLGYYELYVNGRKVGDDVLSPAASRYDKRSYYVTYDIKPYLQKGTNCIGLWLSRGWYWPGYPGVKQDVPIARAALAMETGNEHVYVVTDDAWKGLSSCYGILGNWKWNEFGGERLDARLDMPNWSKADFDDSKWQRAKPMEAPSGLVSAQMCQKNRITQTFPAVACADLGNGLYELDFGKVICGSMSLRLPQLNSGQKVAIYYADKRYQTPQGDNTPIGLIKTSGSTRLFNTSRGPVCYQTFNQWDEFISAGKSGEVFAKKFNYATFRYVLIEGLPTKPSLKDAEAMLIEGDMPIVASFTCSNPLMNRIHEVTSWSNRCQSIGGYLGERLRERLGYGPAEALGMDGAIATQDMPALFSKWTENWLDDQDLATGKFPYSSPDWTPCGGGPSWAGTPAIMAWGMYNYYGDRRVLERCYEPIVRFAELMENGSCRDGLLVKEPIPGKPGGAFNKDGWDFLGDWVAPGYGMNEATFSPSLMNEVFNNCYRVRYWQILEHTATILGKKEDAKRFSDHIEKMRKRIHKAYFDPAKHTYGSENQLYQAFPLFVGIVPEAERAAVLKTLENNILVRRKGHLDFGISGVYYMGEYLRRIGRDDLMYTMLNQKDYPGYGYMLEHGATAWWEQWDGFWAQCINCYCGIGHWFIQSLAGIRIDEHGAGYKKIVIKPSIVGDLTWVKGSYDSIHGRITSNWRREGDKLSMDITIPANTTATVYVPAKDAAGVAESGKPANSAEGVKFLRMENNAAVYAVGSGTYRFTAIMPVPITVRGHIFWQIGNSVILNAAKNLVFLAARPRFFAALRMTDLARKYGRTPGNADA